jgi:hypothetical protein
MDQIIKAAEAAIVALLGKAEAAEGADQAEAFMAAAVGATNILTLAEHSKADRSRRTDGGLLN